MIRLATLGLSHESNTFAHDRVTLDDFDVLRGEDIVERYASSQDTMAGFLAGAAADVDIVPLIVARATPAGPISPNALDTLVDQMMTLLATRGPFDGVLMAQHGAAVAEHISDVDGHILRQVRKIVGADVPIGVALDLHANISVDMTSHSDVLGTYRTNPHVDARERAVEIADIVIRAVKREVAPTQALVQLPTTINILRQNTAAEPMRSVLTDLADVLARPGVLTASIAEGYPYADVVDMGMSIVVVSDADPGGARGQAESLARKIWDRRESFTAGVSREAQPIALTVSDALCRVAAAPHGPVLLLDVGDNIGGGSRGDSTVILGAARRAGLPGLLVPVTDGAAAAAAHRAGVGATVRLRVGADSLAVTGTVHALHDGNYQDAGPTHSGQRHFAAGRTAAVVTDDGNMVVLTSHTVGAYSSAQLPLLSIDPGQFRAIVAKGVHSPLASYGPLATEIIAVDTPGVTSADLSRLHYKHRRRPLYPFEPDARFPTG